METVGLTAIAKLIREEFSLESWISACLTSGFHTLIYTQYKYVQTLNSSINKEQKRKEKGMSQEETNQGSIFRCVI